VVGWLLLGIAADVTMRLFGGVVRGRDSTPQRKILRPCVMLGQATCLRKVELFPRVHVSLVIVLLFIISNIYSVVKCLQGCKNNSMRKISIVFVAKWQALAHVKVNIPLERNGLDVTYEPDLRTIVDSCRLRSH
jgi:hypothetical protein